jgi:DNA-binding PadR family transcriptional regulator
MSVKQGLLAVLADRPRYGAEVKTEFERRTGGAWPLNIGQVYTTLSRLQRDGLVEQAGEDERRRLRYAATELGRAEVAAWFAEPVERAAPVRDELAIKLALAVTVPGVDVSALIQTQRAATLAALQDYTRLKREPAADGDLAWTLVLESLLFSAEAEVRWLDHCEARLERARVEGVAPASTPEHAATVEQS